MVRSAVVTNVVDGDTFDAEVDLLYKTKHSGRFRILGVDAPEVRGASRIEGLEAKAWAMTALAGREVRITGGTKTDSFGRWLVDVELDGEDYATLLVDSGHGVRQ